MDKVTTYNANNIIETLANKGYNYSGKFQEIYDLWDKGLYQGNDYATTDFDDGTPNLILYQEDHYDQHMGSSDEEDDDFNSEKPKWEDMIWQGGDYLFFL